jgi:hypothetical protein
MIDLFAIPFKEYQSSKTEKGMLYNIIDSDVTVHYQCWVAHKKYASHDLGIHNIPGAPTNVKNRLTEELNAMFGRDQWKIITRFSVQQTRASKRLSNHTFISLCQSVWYSADADKTMTGPAQMRV